jgi:hypothetical protein
MFLMSYQDLYEPDKNVIILIVFIYYQIVRILFVLFLSFVLENLYNLLQCIIMLMSKYY